MREDTLTLDDLAEDARGHSAGHEVRLENGSEVTSD